MSQITEKASHTKKLNHVQYFGLAFCRLWRNVTKARKIGFLKIASFEWGRHSTNRVNTLFQGFLRQRISFAKPVLGTILGTISIFLQNAHFRGFVEIPQILLFGAELRADTFCDFLCPADRSEVHIHTF